MRVLAVKEYIPEKGGRESKAIVEYLRRFEDAIREALRYGKVDIAVGPDHALMPKPEALMIENFKARESLAKHIGGRVLKISKEFPQTLLLPGTGFQIVKTPLGAIYGVALRCPVALYGCPYVLSSNNHFDKETDAGEEDLAKQSDYNYIPGDSSKNKTKHKKKKITLEICSDHGKQRVDKDTFLEIILARDQFGGFYVGASNDDFDRYAIVCNSLKKFGDDSNENAVYCAEFNRAKRPKLRIIEPSMDAPNFRLYQLN
ncbi:hypothetical protein J4463_04760 [Candidatus Pacearchaeota archaeon]|nr:hypothetical protein [Candidatus Pacearchaeota archaeon]